MALIRLNPDCAVEESQIKAVVKANDGNWYAHLSLPLQCVLVSQGSIEETDLQRMRDFLKEFSTFAPFPIAVDSAISFAPAWAAKLTEERAKEIIDLLGREDDIFPSLSNGNP